MTIYIIQCARKKCGQTFNKELPTGVYPKGKYATCPFCSKQFVIHKDVDHSQIRGKIER